MDKKNLKILSLLHGNCKISLKEISKSISSSKQSVFQRVRRLEKDVIKGYKPVIDIFRIGYENAYLYLKISGIRESDLLQKLHCLQELKNITWIAMVFGEFDVAFSLLYKNTYELSILLEKIYNEFGDNIKNKELSFSKQFIIPCINFIGDKNRHCFILGHQNKPLYNLSCIKDKILTEINMNAKLSNSELSKKLKISPKTTAKIIKELEKEKIILGYTTILNYSSMNFLWTSCILYISPGKDIAPIINFLKNDKRISWISISIENNIMFDFLSKDFFSLRDFVNDLKIKYDDEIVNYKMINIEKPIKFEEKSKS